MRAPSDKRYWVVRTDRHHLDDVILPALEGGDLRQGWAWLPEQDLNLVGPLVYDDGLAALSAAQRATWKRVQRFWPDHWAPIASGDLILLPNVPAAGQWRLVEATGGYRFSPHPETMDHGHILHITTVVGDIANTNVAVSSPLQRTMRNQGPMWNIDPLAPDIEHLIAARDGVAEESLPDERLQELCGLVLGDFRDRLGELFGGNQLEAPVHRLLELLLPRATVVKTAGSNEHGADFVIDEVGPLGDERRIVVQLKDHGVLSDEKALLQVEEACSWYAPVGAAIIIATADRESPTFATARRALSLKLAVPVVAVLADQLCSWFISQVETIKGDARAAEPRRNNTGIPRILLSTPAPPRDSSSDRT